MWSQPVIKVPGGKIRPPHTSSFFAANWSAPKLCSYVNTVTYKPYSKSPEIKKSSQTFCGALVFFSYQFLRHHREHAVLKNTVQISHPIVLIQDKQKSTTMTQLKCGCQLAKLAHCSTFCNGANNLLLMLNNIYIHIVYNVSFEIFNRKRE